MNSEPQRLSHLMRIVQGNPWAIESFTDALRKDAKKNKALVFFKEFADTLDQSLNILNLARLIDPRQSILYFVSHYRRFNKIEAAYYQKIFEPVLDYVSDPYEGCIMHISSTGFFKRIVISQIKNRFDLTPHTAYFISLLKNEMAQKF